MKHMLSNEVTQFINKFKDFFPLDVDAEWIGTCGKCYRFALILKDRFPEAEIWYSGVEGHVYTKIGNIFYDIRGYHLKVPKDIAKLSHKDGHRPHRWDGGDKNCYLGHGCFGFPPPTYEEFLATQEDLPPSLIMKKRCSMNNETFAEYVCRVSRALHLLAAVYAKYDFYRGFAYAAESFGCGRSASVARRNALKAKTKGLIVHDRVLTYREGEL